jgi:hypothetical protein
MGRSIPERLTYRRIKTYSRQKTGQRIRISRNRVSTTSQRKVTVFIILLSALRALIFNLSCRASRKEFKCNKRSSNHLPTRCQSFFSRITTTLIQATASHSLYLLAALRIGIKQARTILYRTAWGALTILGSSKNNKNTNSRLRFRTANKPRRKMTYKGISTTCKDMQKISRLNNLISTRLERKMQR